MIAMGIRQVEDALNHKGDQIQREFVELSDELDDLGRKILETRGEERVALREKQKSLRTRQVELAEEVNIWRDRARQVKQQRGLDGLRAYLEELLTLEEPVVTPAVEQSLHLMELPEEERLKYFSSEEQKGATTPAGRLIERARMEYDLRTSDNALRQRAAVEFSNRPGIAQDDAILAEIEAALDDQDPIVRETLVLTAIQLHRFRAMRTADLDVAHESVKRLCEINHPGVIPVLIEIVENPRSGFTREGSESVEVENNRSRLIALLRLIEWHTAEAQNCVRTRLFDRDPHIIKAAKRALELFPDPWTGPLKQSEKPSSKLSG
jgi:hypothetical protein